VVIGIDPVALSLGTISIRWFGVLALVGVWLGVWVALRRAASDEHRIFLDALFWVLPAATVTARATHVLSDWPFYFTQPNELGSISLQGMSLWGGLLGGAVILAVRLRKSPLRGAIFDLAVLAAALGIAIGRLGAFVDGHGQGLATAAPWATQYTHPLSSTPDFGIARHPAQVYDGLVALALFIFLMRFRGAPGTAARIFVVAYAAARIVLGVVRLDPPFLFGLQVDQLIAGGAIAFVLVSPARGLLVRRPLSRTA